MAVVAAGLILLSSFQMEDIQAYADQAGVDVLDLAGATFTTGLDPHTYLVSVGQLPPPPPPPRDGVDQLLDCLSWHESRHTPSARNPRSGAAGQYQFLPSTWAGTPQGKAGLSPFDPVAARAAARWMVNQGRKREWVPVQLGLC